MFDHACETFWCDKCGRMMEVNHAESCEHGVVMQCFGGNCREKRYFLASDEETYIECTTPEQPMKWVDAPRADGRMEWCCEHEVGHGNHVHGCDGCCERDDYPGRKTTDGKR
jgi:hypothetical protein